MFRICLILIFLIFATTNGREMPPECLMQPEDGNNQHAGFKGFKSGRIAGGNEAAIGQFPWHVHMMLYDDIGLKMCGGALIKPKWVLTAGMCLVCTSSAMLYFGIVDRLNFDYPWMTHVTNYDHFIYHENYDITNYEDPFADNIGLVFLQNGGDFLLSIPNIYVIDLPVDQSNEDFLGSVAYAAGFGATGDPQTHSSPLLKYVDMNVISNEVCNQTYVGAINDQKICTNTTGERSTCHGDFGAPLTTEVNQQKILIGIGSLRYFNGCERGAPAVFTRVTKYLDWIRNNTSEEPRDVIECDCICHTCPSFDDARDEL